MTSPTDTGREGSRRSEKDHPEQIASPAHPWSVRAEGEVMRIHEERVEPSTSFDGFFEAEHERLYKALYFVTGSRQDAEELMQDAFLKLWERWDRIHTIVDLKLSHVGAHLRVLELVVEDPSGTKLHIATMGLDGSGFRLLTDNSVAAWMPHWSSDGSELVFYRVDGDKIYRLMVMDADGTNVREVAGTEFLDDNLPNLSPDGSLILYTSLISNGQQDVATIPATGGVSTALVAEPNVREEVGAWSPDGQTIAYRRLDSPHLNTMVPTSGPNYEIWVMNADGSDRHLLAAVPDANGSSPEWSPDGSKIAFIGAKKWFDTLYVVDVATGDITEVMSGLPPATGNWLPGRATWMPDGEAVLVTTYAP
jgi:Tol biopolymer transport system component